MSVLRSRKASARIAIGFLGVTALLFVFAALSIGLGPIQFEPQATHAGVSR
jgi:hypothetical protein